MNPLTQSLLHSAWHYSRWGWMVFGMGLGLSMLGFGAFISVTDELTQNVSLWLIMWILWLGWLLVLVQLLGAAGLEHIALAQRLRLPRMAALALRLSTAAMLLACVLAALGMMLAVHAGHRSWAWPWAWALATLTLLMGAAMMVRARGEKLAAAYAMGVALLLVAPTLALPKHTQQQWLSLAAEQAYTLAWAAWALTAVLLMAFIRHARRWQANGYTGWETRAAVVRGLMSGQAARPDAAPSAEADAQRLRADLSGFVLPGRRWPSLRELGQGLGSAAVFGLFMAYVYKLDVAPLLAFLVSTLLPGAAPVLQPAHLSPRAMLLPGGLHRQTLPHQLLRSVLQWAAPRQLMLWVLAGLTLWITAPVTAVELAAIGMAALGAQALAVPLALCALAWRWAPWASHLGAYAVAASLPMATVLLWEGAAIWRPLESPQAWLTWGALTLGIGMLLCAALLAAVKPGLRRLDFAGMGQGAMKASARQ
jgi:hypothetical protein